MQLELAILYLGKECIYLVGKRVRYGNNFRVSSQDELAHFVQCGLDTSAFVSGECFESDFPERLADYLKVNAQVRKGRDGK
jgi:hypothetical protein